MTPSCRFAPCTPRKRAARSSGSASAPRNSCLAAKALVARAARGTSQRRRQRAARAALLPDRHGIVGREIVNADGLGSFAELYPVFQAMEDAGNCVEAILAGLGGAHFARPGADERLRQKVEPTLGLWCSPPLTRPSLARPSLSRASPRRSAPPGRSWCFTKSTACVPRQSAARSRLLPRARAGRVHQLAAGLPH